MRRRLPPRATSRLSSRKAVVDEQLRAVDEARLVAGQEQRGRRDFLGLADPPLLRGQCLERQSLFVDAAQTYQFIIARYPTSEYAYRAKARLETLQQLGRIGGSSVKASAAPF